MPGTRVNLGNAPWRYARHLAHLVNEAGQAAGIGRITGWGMPVMAGVYMIRSDEDIRRACDVLIDSIIVQQQPDGSILECNQHPRTIEDRKIHLGMRGLIKWHQVTGCEKTRKLILELIEGYMNSGLLDEGLPLYSDWPEENVPTTAMHGFANLESLAYADDLTGDRRFVDAAIPSLCRAVEWILNPPESEVRVNFQRGLRGPLRIMTLAHELGLLEKVPAAGGWLND